MASMRLGEFTTNGEALNSLVDSILSMGEKVARANQRRREIADQRAYQDKTRKQTLQDRRQTSLLNMMYDEAKWEREKKWLEKQAKDKIISWDEEYIDPASGEKLKRRKQNTVGGLLRDLENARKASQANTELQKTLLEQQQAQANVLPDIAGRQFNRAVDIPLSQKLQYSPVAGIPNVLQGQAIPTVNPLIDMLQQIPSTPSRLTKRAINAVQTKTAPELLGNMSDTYIKTLFSPVTVPAKGMYNGLQSVVEGMGKINPKSISPSNKELLLQMIQPLFAGQR